MTLVLPALAVLGGSSDVGSRQGGPEIGESRVKPRGLIELVAWSEGREKSIFKPFSMAST